MNFKYRGEIPRTDADILHLAKFLVNLVKEYV